MLIFYRILLALGLIVAVGFAFLVFATGKGDAMGGGGSVRTTFKGKASFDDLISRMTLYLGISFIIIMLGLDAVANIVHKLPGATPTNVSKKG
ncbi:MAG: preprotein translocase subunit SecG [Fimbriimonadaceae bacterium]|nr:preprotein translocase subunit SecG [Fimbriimonadaceae bacterium]